MCLAALSIGQHRRHVFVLAANRDEYYHRPAARLAWWLPEDGGPAVLGGRDLQAGGSWCALSAAGRLALVTNVRRPGHFDPRAPSRGEIVAHWLRGSEASSRFWVQVGLAGYNPFNLIAIDFTTDERFWCGDEAAARRLDGGLYGLSNAQLDTPWPKVLALKQAMRSALASSRSVQGLAERLFEALASRQPWPDADLPRTGIPIERERALSPAWVQLNGPTPDLLYGTRCSTLVIVEQQAEQRVTHVLERSFRPDGSVQAQRHATLPDWPPTAQAAGRWRVERAALRETEYPPA
ncbi:MAG: NRDE family protein [Aquincola tertiaricarbonis]